jgi:REP element-mobilizing transposase RayT
MVNDTARRVVAKEARALGCEVLALDGVADHLHLLVRVPGRLAAAELAKQVKGHSSRVINDELPDGEGFRWQEGYGAFSISRSHLRRVTAYVQQQPERHRSGDLWPEWEQTDEETPD